MEALSKREQDKLEVFVNFRADENLPKYKEAAEAKKIQNVSSGGFDSLRPDEFDFQPNPTNPRGELPQEFWIISKEQRIVPLWMWNIWARFIPNKLNKAKKEMNPSGKIPVEAFFYGIKNSKEELDKLDEMIAGYTKLISDAEESGQQALAEELKDQLYVVSMEAKLYALGYTKYLTEAAVVEFCKESEKGIHADWVKNFTRNIPKPIVAKKNELDEHKIFDNYVILHYDPKGDGSKMTKKEKKEEERKKKDPILFGVIRNSTRLYYIDDWVDELCNLTLEKMAIHFGHSDHKIEEIAPGKVEIQKEKTDGK